MDDEGKSAVRGGFGVFFQRTSYTFATGLFSAGRNSSSFTVNYPVQTFDPGPRSGNLPTDPMLRNGPTVNHAAIDAQFPVGTLQRNTGQVNFDNPDRVVAWSRQYTIGYERQLTNSTGLALDFIRSEQRDQYMAIDLNPPLRSNGFAQAVGPIPQGQITRTNPIVGSVGEFVARVNNIVNAGYIDYSTFQVSMTQRPTRGIMGRLSYAYSKGRGNSGTGQADTVNSQYLTELRLAGPEIGPTNVDRPHILSVNGSYEVPRTGGLRLSAVFQARSGTPFTLVDTTFDTDQNGLTGNEYLPAGTYTGNGRDPWTVDYKGGRNGARGPDYRTFDFRAAYRFRMQADRSLDLVFDIFNVGNRANFANPGGDRRQAATFLNLDAINSSAFPQTIQLNARFAF
jgi:hypothetical protein